MSEYDAWMKDMRRLHKNTQRIQKLLQRMEKKLSEGSRDLPPIMLTDSMQNLLVHLYGGTLAEIRDSLLRVDMLVELQGVSVKLIQDLLDLKGDTLKQKLREHKAKNNN